VVLDNSAKFPCSIISKDIEKAKKAFFAKAIVKNSALKSAFYCHSCLFHTSNYL